MIETNHITPSSPFVFCDDYEQAKIYKFKQRLKFCISLFQTVEKANALANPIYTLPGLSEVQKFNLRSDSATVIKELIGQANSLDSTEEQYSVYEIAIQALFKHDYRKYLFTTARTPSQIIKQAAAATFASLSAEPAKQASASLLTLKTALKAAGLNFRHLFSHAGVSTILKAPPSCSEEEAMELYIWGKRFQFCLELFDGLQKASEQGQNIDTFPALTILQERKLESQPAAVLEEMFSKARGRGNPATGQRSPLEIVEKILLDTAADKLLCTSPASRLGLVKLMTAIALKTLQNSEEPYAATMLGLVRSFKPMCLPFTELITIADSLPSNRLQASSTQSKCTPSDNLRLITSDNVNSTNKRKRSESDGRAAKTQRTVSQSHQVESSAGISEGTSEAEEKIWINKIVKEIEGALIALDAAFTLLSGARNLHVSINYTDGHYHAEYVTANEAQPYTVASTRYRNTLRQALTKIFSSLKLHKKTNINQNCNSRIVRIINDKFSIIRRILNQNGHVKTYISSLAFLREIVIKSKQIGEGKAEYNELEELQFCLSSSTSNNTATLAAPTVSSATTTRSTNQNSTIPWPETSSSSAVTQPMPQPPVNSSELDPADHANDPAQLFYGNFY